MDAGDRVANLLGHLNPAYNPEVPSNILSETCSSRADRKATPNGNLNT